MHLWRKNDRSPVYWGFDPWIVCQARIVVVEDVGSMNACGARIINFKWCICTPKLYVGDRKFPDNNFVFTSLQFINFLVLNTQYQFSTNMLFFSKTNLLKTSKSASFYLKTNIKNHSLEFFFKDAPLLKVTPVHGIFPKEYWATKEKYSNNLSFSLEM